MKDLAHYLRPGTLQLAALPPLSVYVHLPWCLRKCPYCDFNSHELSAEAVPQQSYVDAVLADLDAALPLVWGRSVHSVFLGGGTPSLFTPETIDALLGRLRSRLRWQPDCEVTLEANPGTFEKDRFRQYRQAGITRLSLGVQSFDDAALSALGRVHDRSQALAAAEEAAECFETFNIDLMYAWPGQDRVRLQADLDQALALAPPHLSVYHLTIEPNTFFARFPPQLPDDDLAYEMLDRITECTQQAGLQRYEVSAYARPGHRCWHNLNYWQFGDYLGIGAGAHSKLSFAHRVVRQVRVREPRLYMERAMRAEAVAQEHEVGRADLPFEFMLNALRLPEGFELQRFTERTGLPPGVLQQPLERAQSGGLLQVDLQRIRPTARGLDFLNDLQALFLPDTALP
ncbi:MAG: oxygen-independent coproporphyrinogen III oxidase-like protein [Betaproteobacteria bacterium]|nr:oxygen-independent coproporphyrinogen III oxidase-like protein [Betaproteobacteria bacterium]